MKFYIRTESRIDSVNKGFKLFDAGWKSDAIQWTDGGIAYFKDRAFDETGWVLDTADKSFKGCSEFEIVTAKIADALSKQIDEKASEISNKKTETQLRQVYQTVEEFLKATEQRRGEILMDDLTS